MRAIRAIVCLAACIALAPSAAQEPNHRELLAAFEKQVKATAATAGPSIACVVVSRSEFYPKSPGAADLPGTPARSQNQRSTPSSQPPIASPA